MTFSAFRSGPSLSRTGSRACLCTPSCRQSRSEETKPRGRLRVTCSRWRKASVRRFSGRATSATSKPSPHSRFRTPSAAHKSSVSSIDARQLTRSGSWWRLTRIGRKEMSSARGLSGSDHFEARASLAVPTSPVSRFQPLSFQNTLTSFPFAAARRVYELATSLKLPALETTRWPLIASAPAQDIEAAPLLSARL